MHKISQNAAATTHKYLALMRKHAANQGFVYAVVILQKRQVIYCGAPSTDLNGCCRIASGARRINKPS
jgi:hypothetical protein